MTGPEAPNGTILDITLRALRRLLPLPPRVQTSATNRLLEDRDEPGAERGADEVVPGPAE